MGRLHIRIEGRVQGVGFRWFVRERARELGVAGWVRNTSDGAVEVSAQAPDELLATFRLAVSRGPDGAVVRSVQDAVLPPHPDFPDPFDIIP